MRQVNAQTVVANAFQWQVPQGRDWILEGATAWNDNRGAQIMGRVWPNPAGATNQYIYSELSEAGGAYAAASALKGWTKPVVVHSGEYFAIIDASWIAGDPCTYMIRYYEVEV